MYVFIYINIYTVYVIVEHKMWSLNFIFEGRFVYFFQNFRKRCYIKTEWDDKNEWRGQSDQIFLEETRERKKELAVALIAYEDI